MRFSGVVKMGVPETQDILHCRCLINIVSQPAEGLSPVCPPSSVLLLPHWWGEMEVITWPFCSSFPAEKQVRLCWWSVHGQESENSATLGKACVHEDLDPRGNGGHTASVFNSIQNRLKLVLPSASPCQQQLASTVLTFLYLKLTCFSPASTLEET